MRRYFVFEYICVTTAIYFLEYVVANAPVPHNRFCGFPGSPAYGSVTPFKDQYNVNESIIYHCKPKYHLEGPSTNRCVGDNKWYHPPTAAPLCLEELAHGRNAYQSTVESEHTSASLVVDGSSSTCSHTQDGDKNRNWGVQLDTQYNITKVIVDAIVGSPSVSLNITVNIGNYRGDFRAKQCFTYSSSGLLKHHIERYCSQPLEGQTVSIDDIRSDARGNWRLYLCEVKVLAAAANVQCGEPDNTPFCKYENISSMQRQQVRYKGKPGYSSDGVVVRTCINGKWSGSAPQCKLGGVVPQSSADYRTLSPTVPTTIKSNADKKVGNGIDTNFVIGIAIGVTAAAVFTITMIIILIVVFRKYYKRESPQSVIVTSETDSVFSRGNLPSSSDSSSPRIRLDPWDDPKYHVYDYICEDTLRRNDPSIEETAFIADGPRIDSGGYVIGNHRNGSDRTNSSSASERLRKLGYSQEEQVPLSANAAGQSQPRRVCSYNELEVDAYAYQDPCDIIRV